MPTAFVHTADLHLGADLRRFGPAAGTLRAAQRDAFENILAYAASHGAAFVLIGGDLFDSRFPSAAVVSAARDILTRYSTVPVYILPGTHDFLSDGSILTRRDFRTGLPHVVVLDGRSPSPLPIPGTDCRLHYSVNRSNRSAFTPIADFRRENGAGIHVGMAHGSLWLGGGKTAYDFPITRRDVERSGLDYLALGHWHRFRHDRVGRTAVVYPGIPQPLKFTDPPSGSAAFVTIDSGGESRVEQLPTGAVSLAILEQKIYHPQEVRRLLEKEANDHKIIKTAFTYSDNFNEPTEVAAILASFAQRFLLMIHDDAPEIRDGEEGFETAPGEPSALITEFLSELNGMKAADSPERAELYDKAAELGTRLIRGES